MNKVGVFPGKFLPPHRGHLNSIIQSATQCEKLYVVVSDRKQDTYEICEKYGLRQMPAILRARWLSQELSNFDHIIVKTLNESNVPPYPHGTVAWSGLLKECIPEPFDVIFGGEEVYRETYMSNFPGVEYKLYDSNRTNWPISATEIRTNPVKNWDFILGSARPHFTKRVLITGTESCGKTTMTKYLAKIFLTSWAEEYGRNFADEYLGGNEEVYIEKDFVKIAQKQKDLEEHALRTSNKITFFDTDAVVTQFYAKMYLGHEIPELEQYVDPSNYDLVIMMSPNVKWVDDGKRFNEDQSKRERLHEELIQMYKNRGFEESKILRIDENNYNDRLNAALDASSKLINHK